MTRKTVLRPKSPDSISNGWALGQSVYPPHSLTVLVLLILTACFTRILSGIVGPSKPLNAEGLRSVAMLPYWVSFLGNFFSFIAKFEDFLQQTRYSKVTLPY